MIVSNLSRHIQQSCSLSHINKNSVRLIKAQYWMSEFRIKKKNVEINFLCGDHDEYYLLGW